jgi:hypothetical protein
LARPEEGFDILGNLYELSDALESMEGGKTSFAANASRWFLRRFDFRPKR